MWTIAGLKVGKDLDQRSRLNLDRAGEGPVDGDNGQ
jgi:hypothetical protein